MKKKKKKKKEPHRPSKVGHQSPQACCNDNERTQSDTTNGNGDKTKGNGNELDGQTATNANTNGGDDSLRIDFFPFAYALHDDQLSVRCWYCLAKSGTLKRCHSCHKGMFCNQKCQVLGWKDHRAECKAFRMHEQMPDVEVRLLGRIVARFKAIKLGKDKEDSNFYTDRTSKRSIMEIWSHTDRIKQDPNAMKKFNGIYDELLAFYGSKAMISKDEVFELHCRNYINRHAISDCGYVEEIGKGLYLDLCAYDHSCRPNTIYTCNGFIATLRGLTASVNLVNLSSTHYSYIDLLNTTQERRKLLRDTWYFECHCERCDDANDAILSSILCPNCPEERERLCIFGDVAYKDRVTQIITCPKCQKKVPPKYVMEAVAAMRFIEQIVENQEIEQMASNEQAVNFLTDLKKRFSELLPKVNVYLCKIIQLLIPLVDQSDSRQLLDLHLEAEECVRFCFPYNHPAVAIHYRSIATFFLRCKQPHRALLYCKKACEILKFTLGMEHSLTIESEALLKDTMEEVEEAKKLIFGGIHRSNTPSASETSKAGTNEKLQTNRSDT